MTSYVPRRSREVHAERSRIRNPITDQFRTVDGRENRFMARPEHDEPHTIGAAECVCEEPCRYCHCKETP